MKVAARNKPDCNPLNNQPRRSLVNNQPRRTLVNNQPRRTLGQRPGYSLIELLVVLAMMGILVSIAAPSFRRTVEHSRADIAAANLRAIWSAERFYWLEYRAYTADLGELLTLGLIDPSVVSATAFYQYDVSEATSTSFTATATRSGSSRWQGQFSVDQTGDVSGSISALGETDIVPGFQ